MIANTQGKRLEKYVSDYVVFDLETTGISANYDEIIEISAIKVKAGKITEEFSELVNPKRMIPRAATAVNGITDNMVATAAAIDEVLPRFISFIGNEVLVGHNIHSFDMKFIYRDTQKYLEGVPDNDYIDTLSLARKCLPELSHHRLTDLAEYYKMSTTGAHRALYDCTMNQYVFEKLRECIDNPNSGVQTCPQCGQILKLRKGKFGQFYGCSGYPQCKFTIKV